MLLPSLHTPRKTTNTPRVNHTTPKGRRWTPTHVRTSEQSAAEPAAQPLDGAAYLASPFTTPIHLGATVEVGVLGVVTGNRSASFSARASALVAWNFVGSWYLEASLPELQYLTASGGALALGASVRLGTRF